MVIIFLLFIILTGLFFALLPVLDKKQLKPIPFYTSICILFVSIIIFVLYNYDFNINQFQFVLQYHGITYFDFCLEERDLHMCLVIGTVILMFGLSMVWFYRQL